VEVRAGGTPGVLLSIVYHQHVRSRLCASDVLAESFSDFGESLR
jgi:hypothetical protein